MTTIRIYSWWKIQNSPQFKELKIYQEPRVIAWLTSATRVITREYKVRIRTLRASEHEYKVAKEVNYQKNTITLKISLNSNLSKEWQSKCQVAMMGISWQVKILMRTLMRILRLLVKIAHLNYSLEMVASEVEGQGVELNMEDKTEQVFSSLTAQSARQQIPLIHSTIWI